MKNTDKRDDFIFQLWAEKKLSFKEISELDLPSFLSLKRIQNIVYGNPANRLKSDHEQKIYSIFRTKFLELEDVSAAIYYTCKNQPPRRLKECTIRKIINKCLKQASQTINCRI